MYALNTNSGKGGAFIYSRSLEFDSIVALEPCYGKDGGGGNATRVYTLKGEVYEDRRKLATLLRIIAAHFNADLNVMRKNYGKLLGCRQHIPLPISTYLLLLPLKMRYPKFEKDGATGYINFCALSDATPFPPKEAGATGCLLHMKGSHILPSLYSCGVTEKKLVNARLAMAHYLYGQNLKGGLSSALVMEKADDDALHRIATATKILYGLLVGK